jgi:DNA-binding Lrp family transcriptional regulator
MDAVDRQIIAELQRDGRQTLSDLAERVRLSPSPCHRRLRALERTRVITGYRAIVDPVAVGLGFEALVFVTMRAADHSTLDDFENAVAGLTIIVQAQRLFGEPDYLLRVLCRDLADFQRHYDSQLAHLPGVQKLTSTLVMKTVVNARPLPL